MITCIGPFGHENFSLKLLYFHGESFTLSSLGKCTSGKKATNRCKKIAILKFLRAPFIWEHKCFQAMAWIQAFIKSSTFNYFQLVLEAFTLDSHTFSGFFLQVSLHPWHALSWGFIFKSIVFQVVHVLCTVLKHVLNCIVCCSEKCAILK